MVELRAIPKRGPHLLLLAVYAIFILASVARSAVQISTKFDEAPVAYLLSAVAAVVYSVGWVAVLRASRGHLRLARIALWVELAGVVVVGTLSLFVRAWFPDLSPFSDRASTWSVYGLGYGLVPAALPLLGLWWLHSARPTGEHGERAESGD